MKYRIMPVLPLTERKRFCGFFVKPWRSKLDLTHSHSLAEDGKYNLPRRTEIACTLAFLDAQG